MRDRLKEGAKERYLVAESETYIHSDREEDKYRETEREGEIHVLIKRESQ